jgi:hypothetical protein
MDTKILTRLEAVESQLRRWKIIVFLLLAMLAVVTFLGAAPPQDDQFVIPSSGKLTAHDFTLLGKDGKARGRLYMRGNQAAIELYDSKGNVIWSAPATSEIKPVQAQ